MNNKIYCYIRVSTDKQEYSRQTQILKDRGYIDGVNCKFIEETYTGTKTNRPALDYLLNEIIKKGDTLIVESLTRLSRSGVIKTLDLITNLIINKGVNVIVIKEGFNLQAGEKPDANTSLLLGIFSVLGQFERDLISERTKEALRSKKINGTNTGNPIGRPKNSRTTTKNFIKTLNCMITENVGSRAACRRCNFPETTFEKTLRSFYSVFDTKDYKIIYNKIIENEKLVFERLGQ